MSDLVQTVLVAVIVVLAAAALLRRGFGRRARPGCGCDGCPAKPPRR